MLKYVFGAVFIALAWAAVLVFRETLPLWPAIVVTVLIVLGLGAWAVWKSLKARRAAGEIERALRDQSRVHAGAIRPDMRGEITAMESEFQKAVAALKSSKLGRTGRDALGALPWYVIIGPPGAGKTTALRNSGLKFPYAARGGSVKGVGGTRNCDWWLTNDAILLDTAGRWSTDYDDRDEWLAFLDLLKRTRPRKPVNGLIVAVSAPDLFGSEDDLAALGKTLRERVDEVMGRLDMVLPVYLMVTKSDLVSGFVESFGDLKDKDRGQIWGFSLPLLATPEERQGMFAEHLDELVDVAERRAWERLAAERRLDARQRIFEFPQELADLKKGLHELVAQLFADNVYQDAPIMRGVYFTSGTQEGRPVDRVVQRMAEAFGLRGGAPVAPMPGKPRSYFVRDLLSRVVFLDADVAVRSTRVVRRERIIRTAVLSASAAAAIALLVLPVSSYQENRKFIRATDAFVARLAAPESKNKAGLPTVEAMEASEAMAARLARIATSGPDVSMRFGLYPGDRLLDPVADAVRATVLRPLLEADARAMEAFWRGRGEKLETAAVVDALTLHLLATQPKQPGEPMPEEGAWKKKPTAMLAERAGRSWARLLEAEPTGRGARATENAVRFLAVRVDESGELLDRKLALVSKVRTTVSGSGEGDQLEALLASPGMPRAVRVVDVVGGAINSFRGEGEASAPSVPGAFTPEGWDLLRDRLKKMTDDSAPPEDAWILGARKAMTEAEAAEIESRYYRRYIDTWQKFLQTLSLVEPNDLAETRALLKRLTLERPLDGIWRNLATYLVLKDESLLDTVGAKAAAAADKKLAAKSKGAAPKVGERRGRRGPAAAEGAPLTATDVTDQFARFVAFGTGTGAPKGLDGYHQLLAELLAALGEEGAVDGKAFSGVLRKQRVGLVSLLAGYNEHGWESATLERMLMPPLHGSETAVKGATADSASRKWCDGVVEPFDALLGGKYPFARTPGAPPAAIADVEKFLAPKGGTLWQYHAEQLAADIDNPAGTAIFKVKEESNVGYTSALTDFLKKARELSEKLFASDPAKLGVPVEVRLHPSPPYRKVTFESGGRVEYENTILRWGKVRWPAGSVRIRVEGPRNADVEMKGPWGLLEMIEKAAPTLANDGEEYIRLTVTHPALPAKVNLDVRPAVLLRPFKDFKVPRAIVARAPGCKG